MSPFSLGKQRDQTCKANHAQETTSIQNGETASETGRYESPKPERNLIPPPVLNEPLDRRQHAYQYTKQLDENCVSQGTGSLHFGLLFGRKYEAMEGCFLLGCTIGSAAGGGFAAANDVAQRAYMTSSFLIYLYSPGMANSFIRPVCWV